MKTTMHTPLPWQIDECLDADDNATIRRSDGTSNGNTEEQPIATVFLYPDAELIVRAVNNHEALVKALERTLNRLKWHTAEIETCDLSSSDELTMEEAERALAMATEPSA